MGRQPCINGNITVEIYNSLSVIDENLVYSSFLLGICKKVSVRPSDMGTNFKQTVKIDY